MKRVSVSLAKLPRPWVVPSEKKVDALFPPASSMISREESAVAPTRFEIVTTELSADARMMFNLSVTVILLTKLAIGVC
eukprot:2501847-Rhodomonas_salina.1